jgi:alpha-mannosidase
MKDGTKGKRTAHVISHTHWDREWYLPFEKHRVHLVKLLDCLLDVLEKDPEYKSFHLDGQTIILEDYISVRPERKERLERLIKQGRIHIGPWYILQDEFLTSSEANVRNLLVGHRDAKSLGVVSKVGYFPDSFGNMGQAPQLLRQADIDTAVFGRGVKPTGFNNMVSDQSYESPYSELYWESPDGSKVLGVLFANWYSNGNEIPKEPESAKAYWENKLADAKQYASTPHLLFMNGCDHQPIQTDLSEALRAARELYPDTDFVHSSFDEYLAALKGTVPADLKVIRGELRSQRTDGWGTLVNTASARVYIKQWNQQCQTLLEKVAEPLAAYASLLGIEYPHHLLVHAWKTLMQNHPHDSICGCSVDEVHREMAVRFEKSRQVAEMIADESASGIAERVDTSAFGRFEGGALPFVVFNSTGWVRSGVVSVDLDVSRIYFREGVPFDEMKERLKALPISGKTVVDGAGRELACTVTDLGLRFGYDLPDDRFRQPYFARTLRVEFEAAGVPANGHQAYALVQTKAASNSSTASLIAGGRTMENEFVRVRVETNGSLTLTDKENGKTFRGLCVYEDTGDIGNEYMYRRPNGEKPLTTENVVAEVSVLSDKTYGATLEIVHEWEIPAEAEPLLEQERNELVWFTNRRSVRVQKLVKLTIRTIVSLEREGKGLKVRTEFDNTGKDHRIRVLLPTDLNTEVHYADSIFEAAERDNVPAPEWTNPSYDHHQQAFVSLHDEEAGLTVANRGLNEYEVLRDGRNTIAVTLLRSVGELGDWGVFPTPEAQCLGSHHAEFMIIPHGGGGVRTEAYAEAYQFQVPWIAKPTGVHNGVVPSKHSWISWSARDMALSAVKVSEETGDLVVRFFHWGGRESELYVVPAFQYSGLYKSDVLERRRVAMKPGLVRVLPHEIITLSYARQ